jgi:hypothetical protein
MSQEKPKRKISAALQPPNISDHGGHLATISESGPMRRVSQEGQGPVRKVSTEVGLRRVSGERDGTQRRPSDSNRKVSTYSIMGRKTSFMSAPEKLIKDKVRSDLCKLNIFLCDLSP